MGVVVVPVVLVSVVTLVVSACIGKSVHLVISTELIKHHSMMNKMK